MITLLLCLALPVLAQPSTDTDWHEVLQAAVDQAQAAAPATVELAATAQVVPTRNGGLRMIDVGAPWGPVLMADRLVHGDEPPQVRQAMAHALVARIDAWPEVAVGLVQEEQDPRVLATLLSGLQRLPAELALPELQRALLDPDAQVRVEAAAVLGRHAEGGQAQDALISALADVDPQVRALAARSLGRHQVAAAFSPLRARLSDPDAQVRLQALRALARIDEGGTRALPERAALEADADPLVSRAAVQLRP